jgi:hypothetical protein
LKFEKWHEIAELIGIGAVVVSLLLLMFELRGNTEALQAQTINTVYQAETQRRLLLITNDGGIADLVEKSRNEVLTGTEGFRLRRYYTYVLDTFEYQFGEVQNGRLPIDILSVSNWRGMYGQPGLVRAYEDSKLNRDPAFV